MRTKVIQLPFFPFSLSEELSFLNFVIMTQYSMHSPEFWGRFKCKVSDLSLLLLVFFFRTGSSLSRFFLASRVDSSYSGVSPPDLNLKSSHSEMRRPVFFLASPEEQKRDLCPLRLFMTFFNFQWLGVSSPIPVDPWKLLPSQLLGRLQRGDLFTFFPCDCFEGCSTSFSLTSNPVVACWLVYVSDL